MVKHTVTLDLPDTLFAPFQKIAQAKAQTVEQLVLDLLRSVLAIPLPLLEADEETELIAFKFLSDDTLRGIAREQMPGVVQERMQVLMPRNNFGTITDDEYHELEMLVERGQRLTLRKAWAAGVLMERGHKITAKDMSSENE